MCHTAVNDLDVDSSDGGAILLISVSPAHDGHPRMFVEQLSEGAKELCAWGVTRGSWQRRVVPGCKDQGSQAHTWGFPALCGSGGTHGGRLQVISSSLRL